MSTLVFGGAGFVGSQARTDGDAARLITGQLRPVNGGQTIQ